MCGQNMSSTYKYLPCKNAGMCKQNTLDKTIDSEPVFLEF
jgi:hypothetical protein